MTNANVIEMNEVTKAFDRSVSSLRRHYGILGEIVRIFPANGVISGMNGAKKKMK